VKWGEQAQALVCLVVDAEIDAPWQALLWTGQAGTKWRPFQPENP